MDSINPSIVVASAPSGGGIIDPDIKMIPILTKPPIKIPKMTARIFLSVLFIISVVSLTKIQKIDKVVFLY